MKQISEISVLNEQMRRLQEKFRYYQKWQEQSKYDYGHYNPACEISYEVYIESCNEEIFRNKIMLKDLQEKITDLRKTIKSKQRALNSNQRI